MHLIYGCGNLIIRLHVLDMINDHKAITVRSKFFTNSLLIWLPDPKTPHLILELLIRQTVVIIWFLSYPFDTRLWSSDSRANHLTYGGENHLILKLRIRHTVVMIWFSSYPSDIRLRSSDSPANYMTYGRRSSYSQATHLTYGRDHLILKLPIWHMGETIWFSSYPSDIRV